MLICYQNGGNPSERSSPSGRYVLEVIYRTWRWKVGGLKSGAMKEFHNFRKATAAEKAAYKNKKLPDPVFTL